MSFPFPLPLLLDGATGTNLTQAGMPSGVCVEHWILEHPEPLLKLQRDYVAAGVRALYAPTFGANRAALANYGLSEKTVEFNRQLVALTQSVAKPHGVLVGGDLSPTGLFVPPYGESDFDDIYDIYREQIRALEEASVDFLVIETQTSLADARAAVLAARTTNLPVFVTITVDSSGHTLTGGSLLPFLITMQSMGVDAVGLNCSFGPAAMAELTQNAAVHASVPIIAKPNAGVPMWDSGKSEGYLAPDAFAAEMRKLLEAGASIVGGCCGTTPEHLKALAEVLKDFPAPSIPAEPDNFAAAIEREAFFLGDDIVYSEPMECSSSLGEELIDLDDEQVNAALVVVNSMDDAMILSRNSSMTKLPIAVHCDHLPVLDAALRYFQGRLIVDSNCAIDTELIEPLAAKYGAVIY
ncbi:homocysteine S-methyltransferase family protein [Caproiciproducens sp. LBM24188]